MIQVIIKDIALEGVEIVRLDFACKLEADEQMEQVFEDFFATYGSGSLGFFGFIDGEVYLPDEVTISCE